MFWLRNKKKYFCYTHLSGGPVIRSNTAGFTHEEINLPNVQGLH